MCSGLYMGHNRRYRTLHDASRYAADFALICRGCGREVIIEQRTFIYIVQALGLPSDVAALGSRLRCTACRCRPCIVEITAGGSPRALKLHDGDKLPPKGVSITDWLKWDHRQRDRYLRSLR